MVLLHVCRILAPRFGWKLLVAHFNHQLRGRASDADESFVRRVARDFKLPFVADRADVAGLARNSKLSLEMAARRLRHEFLARVAVKQKVPVVALAHHADDQVELFFLRLLRGAGTRGLAGMRWRAPSPVDRGVGLIRPLLDLTRRQLEQFAHERKIRFREDATNFTLDAQRNRIRNELLPLLQKRYQPGLTKTILRTMDIVGAESEWIEELSRKWLARKIPSFDRLPVAARRRILQLQLEDLNVPGDFDLIERLRIGSGQCVSIAPGISVSRNADGAVKLQSRTAGELEFKRNELCIDLSCGAGKTVWDAVTFRWDLAGRRGADRPAREKGCETFDADQVGGSITVRHWRPGDRFQPIGMKTSVKLQDLFTNAKISAEQRRNLTLAASSSGEIFWVEKLRIGEKFKLTPQTRRRLVWRWRRPKAGSTA